MIDNFTKLLRALNNGQKIDRWHDEYVKIGKNEFIDEYNSIAKVLHRIEKKHGATFKFEAEKLA